MNLYFRPELDDVHEGFAMDVRARLAWELLRAHSVICAVDGGEDTAGRQRLAMMPADEVAKRALAIAESFVTECEARNYLCVPTMDMDQAAAEAGRLESVKHDSVWRKKAA